MIQLNWYKIFGESHQIPDGRTVTPTDDIQIWLHCADIWDKTYTTLAEVLADTSTLVMLMAIDNAVDYLVRSTTWSGDAQVKVPKMTSDTSPEGKVIYSAQNVEDGRLGWKAFDNNDGTTWDCWQGGALTTNQYIGYKFTSSVIVNKVSLMSENGDRIKNFRVRGSDDGSTWTDLYRDICPDTHPTKTLQTFSFVNSTAYQYYSVFVEDIYNNDVMIGAYTVEFAYEGITTSEIAMKSIGASDYASTTLLADSTWNSAIHGSPYSSYVENVSVPTMTSNNTPSGTCSGSTVHSATYDYWKAFDGSADSNWSSSNGNTTNQYLRYVFDYSVTIYKAVIQNRNDSNNFYVKNCKIQYSADGITYLDDVSFTNPSGQAVSTTVMLSGVSGVGFGVFAIDNYGGNYSQIGELQFYGREIGGVQTWLRSANITDKTYTTLSEVLADSTTLSALMSNHNAVDYLVTAKGWADDICADSTAMTYIGLNNYASNTLLADSTWCEAICNSTYFESVLNVKVPVMTSNTTPSGVASASSIYSVTYDAYKAFNGQDSGDANRWASTSGSGSITATISYMFTQSVNIKKVRVVNADNATITIQIKGSDDGVTYTSIGSPQTIGSSGDVSFVLNNANSYTYMQGECNGTTIITLYTLQFYGRQDV